MKKIIVRTDLIDPHVYLELELKYKDIIKKIYNAGGYCLYQQLYKYYKNKSTGYKEIQKLINWKLVGSGNFNNNNYVYLKLAALKYIKYKDSDSVPLDSSIRRLNTDIGHLTLLNSFYTFEMFLEKNIADAKLSKLSKELFCKFIEKIRDTIKQNRIKNLHLIKVEKDDYANSLYVKLKIMGERKSIYLTDFEEKSNLEESILHFKVYDNINTETENIVLNSLKRISTFLNAVGQKNGLNCCKIMLEIITYSEQKKIILEKLIEKSLDAINKKNNYYKNKSIQNLKVNPIISNTDKVTIIVLDIENYVSRSQGEREFNYLKEKTVERLGELNSIFNKGE